MWASYPYSHSPLNLIDGCPVQAFHAWLSVSVCVRAAHRKHWGDVEVVGAERVFLGSCTSVCCISQGVVFQLWEKGITPYHFFHSPVSFLAMPITRAMERTRTHKLTKSQEARLIWPTALVSSLCRVCNLVSPADLAAILHRIFETEGRTRIKEQESSISQCKSQNIFSF